MWKISANINVFVFYVSFSEKGGMSEGKLRYRGG